MCCRVDGNTTFKCFKIMYIFTKHVHQVFLFTFMWENSSFLSRMSNFTSINMLMVLSSIVSARVTFGYYGYGMK